MTYLKTQHPRARREAWFRTSTRALGVFLGVLTALALLAGVAHAGGGEAPTAADAMLEAASVKWLVNNLWIMMAGCLVFIMHLGFATLEAGMTRSKNTVNILFKNTLIICIGFLTYAAIGFNLMYPGVEGGILELGAIPGFITVGGEAAAQEAMLTSAYNEGYTWYTDFFFQAVFAATAATIVSGAVAGRIKLSAFLLFATLFLAIAYPLTGYWKWGGGWLDAMGFYDFAGSTIVHSVGGWAALVMAILLGARLGKYDEAGKPRPMPGHNMPLATVGVFLLWFGWFGFNGGSVLTADAASVSLVLVTTSMAAAAGGVGAALLCWWRSKKPDLSMALNGILAGLVGITAGADQMAIWEAVAIGFIAGMIVYCSVLLIDRMGVDDPVGAISVHLVCGIWGTLAVGIFGAKAGLAQLGYQAVGIVAIGLFTVAFSLLVGSVIKRTIGLRVSDEEQAVGLDRTEHGMDAYGEMFATEGT